MGDPRPAMVLGVVLSSALLAHSCVGQAPPQGEPVPSRPHFVEMDRDVAHLLRRLQDRSIDEFAICLLGRVAPDTVYVTGVAPARVDSAGPLWVRSGCVPTPGLIGHAHNHPDIAGSVGCAVSVADLRIARHPVALHTCTVDGDSYFVLRRRDRPTPVTGRLPRWR